MTTKSVHSTRSSVPFHVPVSLAFRVIENGYKPLFYIIMKILSKSLFCFCILFNFQVLSAPKVAVSIAPIHSLASMVMEGVGVPELILSGGQSPHTHSLTPSSVRKILNAEVVIFISDHYETFLKKPLKNISRDNQMPLLDDSSGFLLLEFREQNDWHHHHHSDSDDGDRDHQSDHESNNKIDPHIWLSPLNAEMIVTRIKDRLSIIDPENADLYNRNTNAAIKKIKALEYQLKTSLNEIKSHSYIVFHDAYQYLEKTFDLQPLTAVTINPERHPGAKRIHHLRKKIQQENVRCIFSEPQFEPKLVTSLAEDLDIYSGELDPLGTQFKLGTEHWFKLMEGLVESLKKCLLKV